MKWILSAGVLAALWFQLFPGTDLVVSGFFYHDGHFPLREHTVTKFIFNFVQVVVYALLVGFLSLVLLRKCRTFFLFLKNRTLPSYRVVLFLFLALVIGPGLIVHQGIKDHWGRPRPVQITEFGGSLHYQPPLVMSDQGGKSFVSGHASMGFYLAALALLYRGRKRAILYASAIALGAAIGFVRIIQGGHFLSDVVFAGIVVLMVIHLLYWLLFGLKSRQ